MLYENESGAKFNLAERRGICPICGQMMTEADRLQEGNHIFVWFKCVKQECSGQWLQRHSVGRTAIDNQQRISA